MPLLSRNCGRSSQYEQLPGRGSKATVISTPTEPQQAKHDAAVSAEVVEDVGLTPGETRRQVTVRDVDVNSLVGKRFRVGEVECLGVELCGMCRHLEEMTRPGIIKELTHRAGINADILVGRVIRVGDPIVEL